MSERVKGSDHPTTQTRRDLLGQGLKSAAAATLLAYFPAIAHAATQDVIKDNEDLPNSIGRDSLRQTIPLPIPGLRAVLFEGSIREVTDVMSAQARTRFTDKVSGSSELRGPWRPAVITGKAVADSSPYIPQVSLGRVVLYNGNTDRYFTDLDKDEDLILPETSHDSSIDQVSDDGKFVNVHTYSERYFGTRSPVSRNRLASMNAYVVGDTNNNLKLALDDLGPLGLIAESKKPRYWESYTIAPDFQVKLTPDGSKIVVSFFEEARRGSYVVELGSWKTQRVPLNNQVTYLSELANGGGEAGDLNAIAPNKNLWPNSDGTLLYAPYFDVHGRAEERQFGAIVDMNGRVVERIRWPESYISARRYVVSPDLDVIAQQVHVRGWPHEFGAFGTAVATKDSLYSFDGKKFNVDPTRLLPNGKLRLSGFGESMFDFPLDKVIKQTQYTVKMGGQDVQVTAWPR
jgi:hypothetical protein